jgi:hypothetical protein
MAGVVCVHVGRELVAGSGSCLCACVSVGGVSGLFTGLAYIRG